MESLRTCVIRCFLKRCRLLPSGVNILNLFRIGCKVWVGIVRSEWVIVMVQRCFCFRYQLVGNVSFRSFSLFDNAGHLEPRSAGAKV